MPIDFGRCYHLASLCLTEASWKHHDRIARAHTVKWKTRSYNPVKDQVLAVSETNREVRVGPASISCSCPARHRPCKHTIAISITIINKGA